MEDTLHTKVVWCCPNNNPWVTSDLKALLNRKKAFRAEDWAELEQVQRELKTHSQSKEAYRKNLEEKLGRNKATDVWSGIWVITSFQRKGGGGAVEGNTQRAN